MTRHQATRWLVYAILAAAIGLAVSPRPVHTQPTLQPIPTGPNRTATGLMDAATETVTYYLEATAQPTVALSGTFASTTTNIIFEALGPNDVWLTTRVLQYAPGTTERVISNLCVADGPCESHEEGSVTSGVFRYIAAAGMKAVRVRMTARGGSDSVTAVFLGGYAQADTIEALTVPFLNRVDATWGTSTPDESTIEIDVKNATSAIMWMRPNVTGDVTGGHLTFEMSVNNGTSWVEFSGSNGDRTQTGVDLSGSTVYDGLEAGWRFPIAGFDKVRIRLDTVITCAGGAGTCTLVVSLRSTAAPVQPFGIARQGEFDRLYAGAYPVQTAQITTVTGTNSTTGLDISRTLGNLILKIKDSGATWVDGTSGISFQMSPDNSQWTPLVCVDIASFSGAVGASTLTNGTWSCFASSGMRYVRVTAGPTLGADVAAIEWYSGSGTAQTTYGITAGWKAFNATGGAGSTNPVLMGGYAALMNADPAALDAALDAARVITNTHNVPFVGPGHPNTKTRTCHVADADGAQTGTLCVEGSGLILVVTGIEVACATSNTVNVNVRVMYDTDTTFAAASTTGVDKEIMRHPGVPPGGGLSKGFAGAYVGIGATNDDIRYSMDDPVSGSCSLTLSYYSLGA